MLSGSEFHKSTTRRLKKSCLTFNSGDCFFSFREFSQFEFLYVAGMTRLHCIAQAGMCTLQSYHPDIAYKPLMADQDALIGPCNRGLLMQEPISH